MSYALLVHGSDPGELAPQGWRSWVSGTNGATLQAAASAVTAIACGTLRYFDIHRSVNGLSTIGLGVCVPPLITAFVPKRFESRTFQVLQSVFGATSFFLATQLGVNYPGTESAVIIAAAVMLGVNLSLMARRFIDNPKGFQSDETSNLDNVGLKLNPISLPLPTWFDYVWKSAAVGLGGYGWYVADRANHLMYRGLSSYLTCFYLADITGRTVHTFVGRKIQKADEAGIEISHWRTAERVVNTFCYFMISLAMIPWTAEPKTVAREHQLWFDGLVGGVLCGILKRAQRKELEKQPIQQTTAFRSRERVESIAFRVWEAVWPALSFCGVSAFVFSQLGSKNLEMKDKISIGAMMYSGYVLATIRSLIVNRFWKVSEEREEETGRPFKRRLFHSLVLSQVNPLFLGISPANIYYLCANVLEMSSRQKLNNDQQLLDWASWFFYGTAMGTEFGQTWGKIKGSVYGMPMFLVMNGVLTSARYLRGR